MSYEQSIKLVVLANVVLVERALMLLLMLIYHMMM